MDVHHEAMLPAAARTPLANSRVDVVKLERDAAIAQLRARLLKLIKDQEQSRGRSSADSTKPR
jgi:hypothetical protein